MWPTEELNEPLYSYVQVSEQWEGLQKHVLFFTEASVNSSVNTNMPLSGCLPSGMSFRATAIQARFIPADNFQLNGIGRMMLRCLLSDAVCSVQMLSKVYFQFQGLDLMRARSISPDLEIHPRVNFCVEMSWQKFPKVHVPGRLGIHLIGTRTRLSC